MGPLVAPPKSAGKGNVLMPITSQEDTHTYKDQEKPAAKKATSVLTQKEEKKAWLMLQSCAYLLGVISRDNSE